MLAEESVEFRNEAYYPYRLHQLLDYGVHGCYEWYYSLSDSLLPRLLNSSRGANVSNPASDEMELRLAMLYISCTPSCGHLIRFLR